MNYITVGRDGNVQFIRLEQGEAQNTDRKYVPLPVMPIEGTPDVELDLIEDVKGMIKKTVEESKPQKEKMKAGTDDVSFMD